jgi:hypothetical protein
MKHAQAILAAALIMSDAARVNAEIEMMKCANLNSAWPVYTKDDYADLVNSLMGHQQMRIDEVMGYVSNT